jgi:RND family efflux transporter MFP subunit
VGALVSPSNTAPGKELFRITQTDTLKVYVNVPQTYTTSVKTGQKAFLTVRNYPDKEFEGTVARSAGALDPNTRTMAFELHFPNKDGQLFAGMYGTVRMPIIAEKPLLTIPTSALVFNAAGLQVALVKDNKVHFQKIEVGRDLGTEIEVTNGISADDQVIANPGERLVENGEVQVIKSKPTGQEAPKPNATARAG